MVAEGGKIGGVLGCVGWPKKNGPPRIKKKFVGMKVGFGWVIKKLLVRTIRLVTSIRLSKR